MIKPELPPMDDYINRYKGCVKKKQYSDKWVARKVAAVTSRHIGSELHAYKCFYCSEWHIGHDNRA